MQAASGETAEAEKNFLQESFRHIRTKKSVSIDVKANSIVIRGDKQQVEEATPLVEAELEKMVCRLDQFRTNLY